MAEAATACTTAVAAGERYSALPAKVMIRGDQQWKSEWSAGAKGPSVPFPPSVSGGWDTALPELVEATENHVYLQ